jgi:hypothetical protein
MTKRYSIIVREWGSDHEVVLAECDSNPDAIVQGLEKKRTGNGRHGGRIPRYDWIRIVDNEAA